MNLTYWDLDYIHNRMKNYDIKYQEIYNELFDHIVTAIEEKQKAGDTGSLERLYTDVVDNQFGGFFGIERVAKSHEDGYKRKVKKMIWGNYRHYINFQSLLFTVVIIGLSFTMPHNKLTVGIFVSVIFMASVFPSVYAYWKLKRIKPQKGKISLVYSHTITQANLPLTFLNCLFWVPQIPYIFSDTYKYKAINVPPFILALILSLVLIYALSSMRLCQQELKQFVNINDDKQI